MKERWTTLWRAVALSDAEAEYEALVAAYGETHRAYHTMTHIGDCLEQLDTCGIAAERPYAVELALWFHDVVYNPHSHQNEYDSAQWATRSLKQGGQRAERIDTVTALILATRHNEVPVSPDACLIVDIDLSILGREPIVFDDYETRIREEYAWVPAFLYRQKRAEILEGFLARPFIYTTDAFRTRYETQARENIEDSIQRLRGA